MHALVYYISYPFIWLIMHLPFWTLYGVSDVVRFILYYVIKYRRRVVWSNLKSSFPEKSDEELKQVEKKFYRFLCDVFLETLKTPVRQTPLSK